jgi:malate/lactate dehydrogenase
MIDVNKNLLACHVMDLETAVSPLHGGTVKAGIYEDMKGSDVVVMAAGAPWRHITNRMELLNDSLPIVKTVTEQIARYCPEAVVITATNPVDPLNYAMHLISGMDRKKLMGYSINDSFRLRMMTGRLLNVDTSKVQGLVVGEHGPHQVMLFSSIRVDGKKVSLSEEDKQKIRAEIPKVLHAYENLRTGRTTGWTSAVGLRAMVSAIVNDTGEVFPCSVILDGEYGYDGLSASLPVKLGKNGWREIVQVPMEPEEEKSFAESMGYLKTTAKTTEELLN